MKTNDFRTVLLRKAEELTNLRANSPVSPRAVGSYRAFVDMLPAPMMYHAPKVQDDGSLIASWDGRMLKKDGEVSIHFQKDGSFVMSFDGTSSEPLSGQAGMDRLQDFVYAVS